MYFITGMNMLIKEQTNMNELKQLDSHSFGYYSDKDEAFESVKNNWGNIQESMYPYVVIESVEEGVFPHTETIQWFAYNPEEKGFTETEVVETKFCGFALG